MTGLSELILADDLDVSMDPETYQDQANPAPITAGNYRVKVVKHSARKDKEGRAILVDDKYPIIVLDQIEIVEPSETAGRKVSVFQDVRTKPFARMNYNTGREEPASNLGDITRAFDQTRGWNGLRAGLDLLDEFIASGLSFVCQLNWTAYDSEFVKAQIEALGGKSNIQKEALNKIYAQAKLKGMAKFPKLDNGKINHVWIGPSGNPVEGRVEIVRYFASLDTTPRLGPFATGN